MTTKEKYELIDKTKINEKVLAILQNMEKSSRNFTDEAVNSKIDGALDKLIEGFRANKPEALRTLPEAKKEVKKEKEKATKENEGKDLSDKKDTDDKTGLPKKDTLEERKDIIKKQSESEKEARDRARKELEKEKEKAKDEVESQIEKLNRLILEDPSLRGFNTGTAATGGGRSTPIIDAERKALPRGSRVSQKGWKNQYGASDGGRKYWENRENRSDRKSPEYETGKPYLAKGGNVYSSDELYIVKVYDGKTNELVDMSKRVWARNLQKAKEEAIDNYEYDMKQQYGDDLLFKVEEAPSMFADGGFMADGGSVNNGTFEVVSVMLNVYDQQGDEQLYEYLQEDQGLDIVSQELKDYRKEKGVANEYFSENGKYYFVVFKKADLRNIIGFEKMMDEFFVPMGMRYTYSEQTKMSMGGYMADGGKVDKRILEKVYENYDIYKDGTNREHYDDFDNIEKVKEHIEKRTGMEVLKIKEIEIGRNYPDNMSHPYYHDDYEFELVKGQPLRVERMYGRPNYSGNVAYTNVIEVKNLWQMADGGFMAEGGKINTRQLNKKIRDWYIKTYPTDEEGKEIDDKITFKAFYGYLWQGYDVYDVLEVNDSLIRERVFEKLSEILGVDYNVVHKKWLQSGEYDKGGQVGDFFYDSRKDKAFQVIFEDGNKMGLQYLGMDKKPIGEVVKIDKNDFEYNVEKGSWGKWKQDFAKGGELAHTIKKGEIKIGDKIYKAWFKDESTDSSFRKVFIKADNKEEATRKAKVLDEKHFVQLSGNYVDVWGKYVIDDLKDDGAKIYAKGGKTPTGGETDAELYIAYENTFKRFDSDVPVPMEDFEKLLHAYQKQLSGDKLDVVKYEVLKGQMGNYLGHKTVEEMEAYFIQRRNSYKMAHGGGVPYKPYGKTKGRFKLTYEVEGEPQSEIRESLEEAMNSAKRYSSPKLGYTDVHIYDESGKEYFFADGGQVDFNEKMAKMRSAYENLEMQVKGKIASAVGIDEAIRIMENDYEIHPFDFITRAVRSGLLGLDEINRDLVFSALMEAENITEEYRDSGQGIGSSDMTYFTKDVLDYAGFKTGFVNNRLTRVDADGNELVIDKYEMNY